MMEKAGFSIAMENASEQVKKTADVVTSSNDRDGVTETIIKFIM
ncbi:MAG: HAD hydrolase family protein [Lachnospiraceae bacterium]|nr:HAD hydrolase family protein [Lachnospiraceae bacterium]